MCCHEWSCPAALCHCEKSSPHPALETSGGFGRDGLSKQPAQCAPRLGAEGTAVRVTDISKVLLGRPAASTLPLIYPHELWSKDPILLYLRACVIKSSHIRSSTVRIKWTHVQILALPLTE